MADLFRWLVPGRATEPPMDLARSQMRVDAAEQLDRRAFLELQEERMRVDPRPNAKRTIEPGELDALDVKLAEEDQLVRRMLRERS